MKKFVVTLIVLMLSACTQRFEYEPKAKDEKVDIAITSDIHYIDPELKDGETFIEVNERSDGKLSIYVEEITDKFIDTMIEVSPDIVIINGDLTYNGERSSHELLAQKLDKLRAHDIQPLVIPGNHDILNAHAYDYRDEVYYTDRIDAAMFKDYYKDCGYTDALSYDEASLSYLYEASASLWLFMLDSNTYEKNTNFAPSSEGQIKEETLAWMQGLLEDKDPDTDVIIFMHHPLIDISNTPSYVITNDDEMLEFTDRNDIELVITGHIHAQNYKTIAQEDNELTDFGISSLSVYDHQYTRLTYKDHKVDMRSIDLDLEGYSDDPFFTDFDKNAREYFKTYSTTRLNGAYDGDDIEPYLSDVLFDLKGEENVYTFSGEGYRLHDLIYNSPYIDEIKKYEDSYAESIFRAIKTFDKDATKFSCVLK